MADPVIEFEIHGLRELTARLDALEDLPRSKLTRSNWRKAANVVRDAAKATAKQKIDDPKTATDIADNIVTRYDGQDSRKTGDIVMRVGVLGGSAWDGTRGPSKSQRLKAPGGSTWYWVYWEFGTEKLGAVPFMRPALEDNIELVTATFVQSTNKAIDRLIKRQARGRR